MYWIDTSALLNWPQMNNEIEAVLSTITLQELEHIKNSKYHDNEIKYKAREAVRMVINSNKFKVIFSNNRKIDKMIKKYSFLKDINDHRILCAAELYAMEQNEEIIFMTDDSLQFLFAMQMPHLKVVYPMKSIEKEPQYMGWKKYYPTKEEMSILYTDLHFNTLGCHINEFAEIYEDGILKDVLFWNGLEYRKLNYKEFNSVLGEHIKPRNLEQKMYLDLLQNKDIPVKLCVAPFGTGKSYLALNYALNALQKGQFEKIIFVKNNLEVKGAGKLGILPGDEISKQMPWLRQIEDHIGIEKFEEYIKRGIIEPAHLSTLRGRDLKNSCIIVDEAENLLTTNIQLLLGRVAENSEIIFCADIKQCDYENEKMSGIEKFIERLTGNALFGMVQLVKTERSETAALADLLN